MNEGNKKRFGFVARLIWAEPTVLGTNNVPNSGLKSAATICTDAPHLVIAFSPQKSNCRRNKKPQELLRTTVIGILVYSVWALLLGAET
jgi:hypothetical protein